MIRLNKEEAESPVKLLRLPVANVGHIDVERLEETLRLYEDHRYGFIEKIPKIR